MAENFSIEHSRTKITEVKKTIEDKKQKLDELKQQKKSLMDAGLALDSSNLDSAVQATLIRVVFMQCIKQATSTTLCQLTIIKLDSGSLLQRKKAIRMLKMYCATI